MSDSYIKQAWKGSAYKITLGKYWKSLLSLNNESVCSPILYLVSQYERNCNASTSIIFIQTWKTAFTKKLVSAYFNIFEYTVTRLLLTKFVVKNMCENAYTIHNVYQSSHSIKNYYTTTQNGISILNINPVIRRARKGYYNNFLMSYWYFVPKHFKYTYLSPNFSISRNHLLYK